MSLDVYLISETPINKNIGTGIFIRKNGKTKELSYEEAISKFPNSIILLPNGSFETTEVYSGNITHNLTNMAVKAGLYEALWRPYKLSKDWNLELEKDYNKESEFEESTVVHAKDLIKSLSKGLKKLLKDPKRFEKYNPENGWGTYSQLCKFVKDYLDKCIDNPSAKVETSR